MPKMSNTQIMVLGAAAVALAACGETKIIGKSLPDETTVVDGPGLELPPDFALRPPREAQDYETVLRAQKAAEAQTLITGVSTTVPSDASATMAVPASDAWLVNKTAAQAGAAQPDIREQLKQDAAGKKDEAAEAEANRKQGLFGRWFGRSNDE